MAMSNACLTRGTSNRLTSPAMAHRQKLTASDFIGLRGAHSVADGRARLAERDQRALLDTRTEAEKYLGDPPRNRSALQKSDGDFDRLNKAKSASGTRVDMWKR
jgi:hypothetical protein